MKNFYSESAEEVSREFGTDPVRGLRKDEIAARIGKYGKNTLVQKKNKSFFSMFIAQFKSFMIILLIIAAVISGIMGVKTGEGLLDTYIIMGILLLNAFIGAYQEFKAQKSLESLKKMAAPVAKVARDGEAMVVNVEDVVPGDLVELEVGDIVPADIRITESCNMSIQESSMTGESVPVEKSPEPLAEGDIPLGDRRNMAYSSGVVTFGHGKGIVVGTGMDTEIGKIADMLGGESDTQTPMQVRLEKLGKVIGTASVLICVVIFIIGILYGRPVINMLMVAVSLAVAAIPEGLPAISTIILSMGVRRMVRHNAIIRKLPSVETLGCTTVICSDKTGTLTKNQMTVVEEHPSSGNPDRLITVSVLCCDAKEVKNSEGGTTRVGDPTEIALIDLGAKHGVHKASLDTACPRVGEVAFDSSRKRMSTINRMQDGSLQVNVKGGLDEILSVCTHIETADGVREITGEDVAGLQEMNRQMAERALRVLAMAYKPVDKVSSEMEEVESGLIFAGMTGMIDPEREEVIGAIKECHEAGIRTIMITGDHKATALAIATKIGIHRDGDLSITGTELDRMDEKTFGENVDKYTVYARIAPEQKVKIVTAWQKKGEIVAMTGDGVNDAPALKQADIGVSMGITGTEVAKDASDMILSDDNFVTIVSAVSEGRRIYDNILKTILFLLSTNLGEVLLLFVTSIFNMGIPLLPIHILWINLVSETFPALALSLDPAAKDIMKKSPRGAGKQFMDKGMVWRIGYQGVMMGAITLVAFLLGKQMGYGIYGSDAAAESLGQTMAFASLIAAKLVHAGNLHSNTESRFRFNPLENKPLIFAIFASLLFSLSVLLVPSLAKAFSFTEMGYIQWLTVAGLALVPLVVVELFKALKWNGR
ncbi:MAG: calcium-translocating P-type ATPase, PMCA-type [Bacteroidetes bacterium]|uniref:P-type Ca(2+) transporter n=1 Tax=Candidatus Cryptobacteroides merdigallinarum TaxID=2840770 RepID=A0A9D9HEM1_9BACT|nr:calcium-translocating P-type ATPase, PMCA-type [Candidatus Cryptobacteroides merdigallinarum]